MLGGWALHGVWWYFHPVCHLSFQRCLQCFFHAKFLTCVFTSSTVSVFIVYRFWIISSPLPSYKEIHPREFASSIWMVSFFYTYISAPFGLDSDIQWGMESILSFCKWLSSCPYVVYLKAHIFLMIWDRIPQTFIIKILNFHVYLDILFCSVSWLIWFHWPICLCSCWHTL